MNLPKSCELYTSRVEINIFTIISLENVERIHYPSQLYCAIENLLRFSSKSREKVRHKHEVLVLLLNDVRLISHILKYVNLGNEKIEFR